MDFSRLITRVTGILAKPRQEWPLIAGEQASVATLYRNYILWLAAIPPVFAFIKNCLIGSGAFGYHWRVGIGAGLGIMLVSYLLTLVLVYVMALIIHALAGSFDAQKNMVQALKTAAYAYTAWWVAGVGRIVPWLGILILLAGGIYSIYLLYLGLPQTMKCPREKAAGYTAVSVVIGIVLSWVLMLVVGGMFAGMAHDRGLAGLGSDSGSVTFDKDSRLGQLEAMSKRMQEASRKMQAAQDAGDKAASGKALGTMLGAMSGSNGPVEALPPARIRTFLPEQVNGMPRTAVSAERNQAMGMQVSQASATYESAGNSGDGSGHRLNLEIVDTGGARALLAMAGMFGHESEKQTADGYERVHADNGRMYQEKWNDRYHRGRYAVVVGGRFKVEANGDADSFDQLKQAVESVDLDGLEALKDAGVQSD